MNLSPLKKPMSVLNSISLCNKSKVNIILGTMTFSGKTSKENSIGYF